MTENSQLLEDAEREVARLIEQAEQEKAMAAVLPARFERNIAIFEELMPEIAKNFKNYKPTRNFRFFVMKMVSPIFYGLMIIAPYTVMIHIKNALNKYLILLKIRKF